MRKVFTLIILISCIPAFSQKKETTLEFLTTFNNLPLVLNNNYKFKNDSLKITALKFYISNINFYYNNQLIESFPKRSYLIDFENPKTTVVKVARKNSREYNRISYNIGIDSLTNVAGALGDDLDPSNGMYWTWQSGYINIKLEGQSKICPSRNNLFIFHIGGYQYPYNSIQLMNFSTYATKKNTFNIDIFKLLNTINLNEVYQIMSPNKKALSVAKKFADAIKIME
jgi:hypothetical protein